MRYNIDTKNEWDALPVPKQTFGKFYNIFGSNFTKFKYMTGGTSEEYSNNKTLWINTVVICRGGRGIFGSHGGFVGYSVCGCGVCRRGQGRGGTYTPYRPPYSNINIKIEARQCPKE